MKLPIQRLVDLRPGEAKPLLQAFFTLFGIIAAHTILETARDTLFLEKLPPKNLAFVYALLAGITFVSSAWNARFVQSFGRRYALIFTLVIAAYGTTLLHFQPLTTTTVFVLYLWSGVLGTVMTIQFFSFAGQLFTIAQSKRLLGPVASGGVLGAVAGASGAAIALEMIPVSALLLVSAGLFISTALFLTTLKEDETTKTELDTAQPKAALPQLTGVRALFRENPYLIRMALLVVLSTAAVLATDYLFKSVAAATYEGKALGNFFARYYAVLNAASLVVQVGLAGRLIRTQGVMVAVLVLPMMLLAGSAGIAIAGGILPIVLLTKGADGALRHSLHRVASELLWMPLPSAARDRGKALIDGVVGRATQAIVAGLILGLAAMNWTQPRVLAGIVVVFSLGWVFVAFMMRRPYLDLFRQALRKGSLDVANMDELDLSSVEAVLESLSSTDTAKVTAAMELLAERGRSRLIPGLILYHESEDVLVRALELVPAEKREDWVPLAERLMTHSSERVRTAVVRAFARQKRTEQLAKLVDDPSPSVRAHVVFNLAHLNGGDPLKDDRLVAMLALDGEARSTSHIAMLQAIRDNAHPKWADLVLCMVECEGDEVLEHAAAAMAKIKDPRFIPILIQRLGIRDGRDSMRAALVELGEPALDALQKALFDPDTDPRVRLHIPRSISRFMSPRAAAILVDALTGDAPGLVRYKALRGLGRLVAEKDVPLDKMKLEAEIQKNLIEHLRMLSVSIPLAKSVPGFEGSAKESGHLLNGLVDDKSRQALERAFRLLQITHRNEDLRSVHMALNSSDKRTRANAQEFLDVLATTAGGGTKAAEDRRELFRIVADDLPPEERVRRAARFLPRVPADHQAAISALVRDSDEYVASLASYHALEVGVETLRDEVTKVYEERPSLRTLLDRVQAVSFAAAEALHG